MNSDNKEICGVLERIIFSNSETQYCVGEFHVDDSNETIVISGKLPSVQCGETLRLNGFWRRHPRHGPQFNVESFKAELPATVHGIRKYLGSGLVPGIGKVYAEKIVDAFKEDTLKVISDHSGRLREVPGIGKQRAQSIKKAWDDQAALRGVMMFLKTYGVGTAQCLRLVKKYGNEAQQILKSDPYRIAREMDYIGFKTADKIALNLGFSNECVGRVEAGILFALAELEGEGHSCCENETLKIKAVELLDVGDEFVVNGIERLVRDGYLREQGGMLQSATLYRAEEVIARHLKFIADTQSCLPSIIVDKAVEWAQEKAGFEFAKEQKEGLPAALIHKLSIITGGPGTGKTTILKALVSILKAKKVNVLLAAPTGRASQRMAEATGAFAQTLHRLLAFDPAEGNFTHNEDSPLKADFVIVDESSMLDVRLAASLFRAIPAQAHLLLVGDINQLPSVGAGDVLGDLIRSGYFQVTRLEHIFRQGARSEIVSTAHNILAGNARPPHSSQLKDIGVDLDMHFVPAEDADDCMAKVIDLSANILPLMTTGNSVMDIQVLAPMHKGTVGVSALNRELQQALNASKSGVAVGAQQFRIGDKVIQTRNNYDKNIFNGDIGCVQAIDLSDGIVTVRFDSRVVELERMELGQLQLAYAISIHKSQGSEFPIVIVPLMKQHFIMLQRNLLYTAITRGRKKVIVVGEAAAYAMAVNNSESMQRITALRSKMLAQ